MCWFSKSYFKWPSTCPIHKKLGLVKYELDINVYHWKTDYFVLQFLYKTDLRTSSAGKHLGIIRFKKKIILKNDNIFHNIDQIKFLRLLLPSLQKGALEITLTVPLSTQKGLKASLQVYHKESLLTKQIYLKFFKMLFMQTLNRD